MLPTLSIGPLSIQLPGLLLLLGLWLGLSLAEKTSMVFDINPNDLYNFVFAILIGAVITARLVFIATYPSAFVESPLSLLSLSPELLDIWGGIAGGIVGGLIFVQKHKLQLLPALDALVPALSVLAIFIAFSDFASGNAFGSPTTLPWGIFLWGETRHPSQLYQALAAILILIFIWANRHKFKELPAGTYFLMFLSVSAASRLFLEYFRGDSTLLPGGFRAAQITAWMVMAASLWGIRGLMNQRKSSEIEN